MVFIYIMQWNYIRSRQVEIKHEMTNTFYMKTNKMQTSDSNISAEIRVN